METKVCTSCDKDLPVTKFKYRSAGGRQSGQRQAMCNRCLYVKYTRPLVEQKTQEIHKYQMEKGCMDCGYNEHPAALEFDHHVDSEKSFNIGEQIGSRSRERLWEEIAKCDVVCANCHAIRTATRRQLVEIEVM
jgi:ribosomal protein L44E